MEKCSSKKADCYLASFIVTRLSNLRVQSWVLICRSSESMQEDPLQVLVVRAARERKSSRMEWATKISEMALRIREDRRDVGQPGPLRSRKCLLRRKLRPSGRSRICSITRWRSPSVGCPTGTSMMMPSSRKWGGHHPTSSYNPINLQVRLRRGWRALNWKWSWGEGIWCSLRGCSGKGSRWITEGIEHRPSRWFPAKMADTTKKVDYFNNVELCFQTSASWMIIGFNTWIKLIRKRWIANSQKS